MSTRKATGNKVTMRTVSWGDALLVETFKAGGMAPLIRIIQAEVGEVIGARVTFSKLLQTTRPDELTKTDRWRTWLLLTAARNDPADWGISDDAVPPAIDIDRLRAALYARRDSNPQPSDWESAPFSPAFSSWSTDQENDPAAAPIECAA